MTQFDDRSDPTAAAPRLSTRVARAPAPNRGDGRRAREAGAADPGVVLGDDVVRGFGPRWAAHLFAVFMLAGLAAGFIAVVLTGTEVDWPGAERSVIDGEWTGHYETGMDDGFATRDAAVALWSAIEWSVFGDGRRGVIPGRDGWLFTVEEFERPPGADGAIAAKLEEIVRVRDRLAASGVRLVVALVPDKSRVYEHELGRVGRRPGDAVRYQAFRGALAAAGVAAPDLLAPLARASLTEQTYMRTDTHWTPAGAAVAARALADGVRAMPDPPPSLGSVAFVTRSEPAIEHSGDLLRFIPLGPLRVSVWGPLERLQPQVTRAEATNGETADLLFGEQTVPAVLIGTSFSAMAEWNFDGALKQALGMDVLNLAGEGGGPMAPMGEYLDSNLLRESPPELVIWEIPERYLPVRYEPPVEDVPRAETE